jgi:hypothetical protein
VYDDRCRTLYRTPDVYLNCNEFEPKEVDMNNEVEMNGANDENETKIEDQMNNEVDAGSRLGEVIFTIKTKSLPVDNYDDTKKMKSVIVISTPYREGEHWTTYPTSFLPIIDQLSELHNKGYVHGDIRVYNIIFNNIVNDDGKVVKKNGWLIDFDFGGKCDGKSPVRYPPGYLTSLDDGRRIGVPGQIIRKWHDWYALGQLIFTMHTLTEPPEDPQIEPTTQELLMLRKMVHYISKWNVEYDPECEDKDIPYDIEKLRDFLQEYEYHRYTLCPRKPKKSSVKTDQLEICRSCKEGTGSPIQKKI